MKLKQLKMKAFGSFAKETVIDFDSMDGLWLTTGPTGSGKTTVFDAVMYALYGKSSGNERDGSSMRSGYARPEEETFVELRFEQQGKEWTVYRSPAYLRPKQRGEGFTNQPARATLSSEDESLDKNIDTRLTEIIGVNASQFCQLAMIAQNDFRRILTENAQERCVLLRKLLGTECYERFQKKLKEKYEAANTRKEDDRKAVIAEASRFGWDAESLLDDVTRNYAERKDTESVWPEQAVLDAMKAQCERENGELARVEAEIKPLREKQTDLAGKLAVTENRHKRFELRSQLAGQVSSGENEKPERENRRRLLNRQTEALDIMPFVKGKDRSIQELKNRETALTDCEGKLNTAGEELKAARQSAEQTEALKGKRDSLLGEIRHLTEDVLPLYGNVKKAEEELRKISNDVGEARAQAEKIRLRRENNRQETEKQKQAADTLPQAAAAVLNADAEVKNAEERVNRVQKLKELEAELNQRRKDHAEQEKKTRQKLTKAMDADKELLAAKTAYYAAQAYMLAVDLKPGAPCPVCGSMDHPSPAVSKGAGISLEQMEFAEDDAQEAKKAYDTAKRELDRLWGRVEETENSLKAQTEELGVTGSAEEALTEANTALADRREKLRAAKQARKTAEDAKEEVQRLEQTAKELENEQKQADTDLQEKEKNESAKVAEVKTLRDGLPKEDEQTVRGTVDGLRDEQAEMEKRIQVLEDGLKKAEQTVNTLNKQREDAKREKESAARTKEEAEQELAAQLREHAFSSGEEVTGLTKNADRNGIRAELNALAAWFTTLENRKKDLAQLEEELKGQEDTDPRILQDALERLKTEINTKEQAQKGLLTRIESNREFCGKTFELAEKARKSCGDADFWNELFLSTQSRRGGMTFEIYVQRYYFDRVVRLANRHLNEMTGDALQLCLQEPEESKTAYSGLDLSILDRATGKERNVATLSGGESFMASMSLALGLSDLVSTEISNVDLGILFIDEGFGTLDEDSLQQVLGVLNSLTEQSGKLVNVISHRPELREAIRNQIRVKKTDRGSEITVQYR